MKSKNDYRPYKECVNRYFKNEISLILYVEPKLYKLKDNFKLYAKKTVLNILKKAEKYSLKILFLKLCIFNAKP